MSCIILVNFSITLMVLINFGTSVKYPSPHVAKFLRKTDRIAEDLKEIQNKCLIPLYNNGSKHFLDCVGYVPPEINVTFLATTIHPTTLPPPVDPDPKLRFHSFYQRGAEGENPEPNSRFHSFYRGSSDGKNSEPDSRFHSFFRGTDGKNSDPDSRFHSFFRGTDGKNSDPDSRFHSFYRGTDGKNSDPDSRFHSFYRGADGKNSQPNARFHSPHQRSFGAPTLMPGVSSLDSVLSKKLSRCWGHSRTLIGVVNDCVELIQNKYHTNKHKIEDEKVANITSSCFWNLEKKGHETLDHCKETAKRLNRAHQRSMARSSHGQNRSSKPGSLYGYYDVFSKGPFNCLIGMIGLNVHVASQCLDLLPYAVTNSGRTTTKP